MSTETEAKIVNVLSIDAWSDGDQGWNWNAWYKVGTVDLDTLPESRAGEADLIRWFVSEGYATDRALTECEIDDDRYNLVLVDRESREPLFAIAYGEIES